MSGGPPLRRRLRSLLHAILDRLDRYRWWAASAAAGAAVVLGSLYERFEGAPLRLGVNAAIFVLGGVAVLLTFSLLQPDAGFASWQPWVASVAGGGAGVLAAVVNGLNGSWLAADLTASFLLGAVAVIFTKPRRGTVAAGADWIETPTLPIPIPPNLREASNAAGRDTSPRVAKAGEKPAAAPLPALPRRQSTFRARTGELVELRARHDEAVSGASGRAGPAVLLVHGVPGVGKSELVLEFAHSIADLYADGALYVNLGLAGSARRESDVLKDLLEQLQVSEIPEGAAERARLFRGLTSNLRLLIVLDAARSSQQVEQLLPKGDGCTVVVASRPNFGPDMGVRSMRLRPPNAADAGQILRVFARREPADAPVCAATILDAVGRLPVALRAAGELAAGIDNGLCRIARRLAEPGRRLAVLGEAGPKVESAFESQYKRLLPQEQQAFRLLSLVPSETFIAWVLCPLLEVSPSEAENLMAQLSAAELIETVRDVNPTALQRYRFPPLAREYADRRLEPRKHDGEERQALDAASLAVAARALEALDPTAAGRLVVEADGYWLSQESELITQLLDQEAWWLRVEHPTLERVVRTASEQRRWEVCWRVAARLGGSIPTDVDHVATEHAFALGQAAADAVDDEVGRAEVTAARGMYLISVERYEEAFSALDEVTRIATSAAADPNRRRLDGLLRRAASLRVEAYLQMAEWAAAEEALATARPLLIAGDPVDRDYLAVLTAYARANTDPEGWQFSEPYQVAIESCQDDMCLIRAYIGRSEAMRREGNWDGAVELLQAAQDLFIGDARRTAALQLHRGRQAWLRSLSPGSGVAARGFARDAVDWLASALVTFERMGNVLGGIRARCTLVRALVSIGQQAEAAKQFAEVRRAFAGRTPGSGLGWRTADARQARAEGELLLASEHRLVDAASRLTRAQEIFEEVGDWASAADTRILLGRAHRLGRQPLEALADLYGAAAACRLAGDIDRLARARREIAEAVALLEADHWTEPLPSEASLPDLLGVEATPEAVVASWRRDGDGSGVPVGESPIGPFLLDVPRDGPHLLIVGSNGSGKTELLRTLITGLALQDPPDQTSFFLVDLGGGTLAHQLEQLPHTAGVVRDLNGSLAQRMLRSLEAEARRRQKIVGRPGGQDAAGSELPRVVQPPLPRLVIVVDGLPALDQMVSGLVPRLLGIARPAVGIHLVLATNRASSSLSPLLRRQCLRIALHVSTPHDSSAVIGSAYAAKVPRDAPGLGYARLGPGALVPFQAASVGPGLGQLVGAICTAARQLDVPVPHPPVLEPLPSSVRLSELPELGVDPGVMSIPYGLEDIPAEQNRAPAVLELTEPTHLVAAGDPGSGRSQLLRTLAGAAASRHDEAQLHVYGIDCAGGALLPLTRLPHCGAVVTERDVARASRMFSRLTATVRQRRQLLTDSGMTGITEHQPTGPVDRQLPQVLVLLDGYEHFAATLGRILSGQLIEQLAALLQDGGQVGVHVVLCGGRDLLHAPIAEGIPQKLVLTRPSRGVGAPAWDGEHEPPSGTGPGRAVRLESGQEIQVALLDGEPGRVGQGAALAAIATAASSRDAAAASDRLPFRVDDTPLIADRFLVGEGLGRPIGREDVFAWLHDRHSARRSVTILGPRRAGKSWVLIELERRLQADGARSVRRLVLPMPSRPVRSADALAVLLNGKVAGEASPAEALLSEAEMRAASSDPLVFLLDEAGRLTQYHPAAVSWLRDLSEAGAWLVFSGTEQDWHRAVRWALTAAGSSFGNNVNARELGPWDESTAITFLSGTAANQGVDLPPDTTAKAVVRLIGTWPFYLQVVGDALVTSTQAGVFAPLSNQDALRRLVERRLLDEWSHHFEGRWAEIGRAGRSALLVEPGASPELLAPAQRNDLRDVGLLRPGDEWLVDPPFFLWVARNAASLRDRESDG